MKETILWVLKKSNKKALQLEALLSEAKRSCKEGAAAFHAALEELVRTGQVVKLRGTYRLITRTRYRRCQVVKVAQSFGFVKDMDADKEYFIPGRALMGAMPGDIVIVELGPSRGDLPEGEVISLAYAKPQIFTGVFYKGRNGSSEIEPDTLSRFPIAVEKGCTGGAQNGDKVLAEITRRGKRHYEHKSQVLQVFGSSDSAEACTKAILAVNDIPLFFPEEVLEEAAALADATVSEEDCAGRLDLRDWPIFTIDSADTKDIDDAISLKITDRGYELGVHIADVSHYVKEHSHLDEEAFSRGTSVYYGNSVVPMLPKELSNGICSLNPQVDRLAFSALMVLDSSGALQDYSFRKTVIRSRVKGVYREINALLAGEADDEILEKYKEVAPSLRQMEKLATLLTKRHHDRGSLDLETAESKIILNENNVAIDVQPRGRGFSEQMIEEFMLCANEAAATLAKKADIPFVYRVHEDPSEEKLASLATLLRTLGIDAKEVVPGVRPLQLSKLLEASKGTPYHILVNHQLLRSMAKAKYSEEGTGHFGLVLQNYSHFTSPIRRYPDLSIHRILSAYVGGLGGEKLEQRFSKFAHASAQHSSDRELKAMAAERECDDAYKAEYMQQHLGERFEGVISSVAPHGVYVQLPNTVEGLVRTADFPVGNYTYEENLEYRDSLTGRRFRIGDLVSVQAVQAEVSSGHVDFVFVPQKEDEQ